MCININAEYWPEYSFKTFDPAHISNIDVWGLTMTAVAVYVGFLLKFLFTSIYKFFFFSSII